MGELLLATIGGGQEHRRQGDMRRRTDCYDLDDETLASPPGTVAAGAPGTQSILLIRLIHFRHGRAFVICSNRAYIFWR